MRLGATLLTVPLICAAALACAGGNPATTSGPGDTPGGAQQGPDPAAAASDRSAVGSGAPAGFAGRTDDPAKPLAGAGQTRG